MVRGSLVNCDDARACSVLQSQSARRPCPRAPWWAASGEGGLGGEDTGLTTHSEMKLRQEETGKRGRFSTRLLFLGPLEPRLHLLGAEARMGSPRSLREL